MSKQQKVTTWLSIYKTFAVIHFLAKMFHRSYLHLEFFKYVFYEKNPIIKYFKSFSQPYFLPLINRVSKVFKFRLLETTYSIEFLVSPKWTNIIRKNLTKKIGPHQTFFLKNWKNGLIRTNFCLNMCDHFELSENLTGWIVSKSRNVNDVDYKLLLTTERHFGWDKDILTNSIFFCEINNSKTKRLQ